ncbi:MAG: hypothetical protein J6Z80_00295 [Clostridia bacterium]|nr:hypothetical protein [Clostridia bacterium]
MKTTKTSVDKIDFHSHILPGIDDGAKHSADSVQYVHRAREIGIETVIATPHFYPHKRLVRDFLSIRNASFERLMSFADDRFPKIVRGAEVLCCAGIDRMEGIERLCVEGTDILMLELPFNPADHTEELFETVENLIERLKLQVIMVHPHRYPDDTVMRMVSIGSRLQLNAADASGRFSLAKRTKKFIDTGAVCALGTDMHRDIRLYDAFLKASLMHADDFKRLEL